jgi:hypothetical protein
MKAEGKAKQIHVDLIDAVGTLNRKVQQAAASVWLSLNTWNARAPLVVCQSW